MAEICIHDWRKLPEKTEGIAVVLDIFRCSSTLYSISSYREQNNWIAKNLIPVKGQAQDFRIFSELDEQVKCKARFDNSPAQALSRENTTDLKSPYLVATTSGTPAMFAARCFSEVWVGSIVNFSSLCQALSHAYHQENKNVTLLPAALPDSDHVEDAIAAESIAVALDGFAGDQDFIRKCAKRAQQQIQQSGRVEFLTKKLETGADDMAICLDIDRFDFLLKIQFRPGRFLAGLAEVEKCNIG